MLPLAIGVGFVFGGGAVEFAGVSFALGAIGVTIFNMMWRNKKRVPLDYDNKKSGGDSSEDPDDPDQKKRKENKISKKDFFNSIKNSYEYWRDQIYKRKPNNNGIENAEYLKWDHLRNDIEAYNKYGKHIGSIDPQEKTLYKPADIRNKINL